MEPDTVFAKFQPDIWDQCIPKPVTQTNGNGIVGTVTEVVRIVNADSFLVISPLPVKNAVSADQIPRCY